MLTVKITKHMGRAVYTEQDIEKNTIVMVCELLILTPEDTEIIKTTSLKYYTFRFNEKQECLVLGLGQLLNHSNTPNLSYHIVLHDGRYVMEFRACRSIQKNEELFIDYRADEDVTVEDYFAFKPVIS